MGSVSRSLSELFSQYGAQKLFGGFTETPAVSLAEYTTVVPHWELHASPGYIRNSCVRTLRPYQDKDHILVIWSSHHHSSIGSNGKSQSINLGNILCSNTHLSALGCPLALIVNARLISNKSFILNDLFISYSLDLFVTETWLKQGDFRVLLGENDPSVCASFRSPPASGYGSGVATISRNC